MGRIEAEMEVYEGCAVLNVGRETEKRMLVVSWFLGFFKNVVPAPGDVEDFVVS